MPSLIEDFSSFLSSSPTSWHTVKELGNRLSSRDFHPLNEADLWNLKKKENYFVARGGSFASFSLPSKCPESIVIFAAHTDSPSFKLKAHPDLQKAHMGFFSVEPYGSPIVHSWTGRDCALAGRIFVRTQQGKIVEHLVFMDDIPMIIPELAIHLHREVNEKGPLLNLEDHFMPLFSLDEQGSSLETLLRRTLSFEKLLSFDLFLVPLEGPRFLGVNGEMLSSYRIDNLTSVHAAASALMSYQDSAVLPLGVFWDHEEVGSTSFEGAASSFLSDILTRIRLFYDLSEEAFLALKSRSLCFSIDMAHGFLPMHPNKYSDNHRVFLGKGIALKSHAKLSYASSASTLAIASDIALKANIPLQNFASRADFTSGSTVGPFIASMLGIPTVDLGAPQLSMHSAREVLALQDYLDLVSFLSAVLQR